MLFFLLRFGDDLIKFTFFMIEGCFFAYDLFFYCFQRFHFISKFFISIPDMLLCKLTFELLHFHLLIYCFKLTTVLYRFTLFFIFFYQSIRIFNCNLLLLDKFGDAVYLFLNAVLTACKSL